MQIRFEIIPRTPRWNSYGTCFSFSLLSFTIFFPLFLGALTRKDPRSPGKRTNPLTATSRRFTEEWAYRWTDGLAPFSQREIWYNERKNETRKEEGQARIGKRNKYRRGTMDAFSSGVISNPICILSPFLRISSWYQVFTSHYTS